MTCITQGQWHVTKELSFVASSPRLHLRELNQQIPAPVSQHEHILLPEVLALNVDLTGLPASAWPRTQSNERWSTVDLLRSKSTFDCIAWATNRIRIPEVLKEWATLHLDVAPPRCEIYAPSQPSLQWHVQPNGKLEARENQLEAAR